MPSVGNILREARLQAGLTLEQISARTRICVRHLRAIEEDDLAQITSAFFYKSFVRQFSDQVGIRYDELAPAVQDACRVYPETLPAGSLQTVLQRSIVKPRKQRMDFRVPVATAGLLGALVVCSSVYALWRQNGSLTDAPARISEVLDTAKSWLPGQSAEPPKTTAQPTPDQRTGDSVAQQSAIPVRDDGFRVELSAIEPSWLSVSTDGRQKFSGILKPDQSEVVEGHDRGRMRTGNAGGVKLTFNGKDVGVVGPRGQVRVVVFTKDRYEVLDPNAGPNTAADNLRKSIRILPVSWNAGLALAGSPLQ